MRPNLLPQGLGYCRQEPSHQIFAVGDDWQAIYRFAGADISVMRDFGDPAYACALCKSGEMQPREGASGIFWGCSNWPYCEHTARHCPTCGMGFLRCEPVMGEAQ